VYKGSAYGVIERGAAHRLFIGHPLRCDNASLRVEWLRAPSRVPTQPSRVEFRVHNPMKREESFRVSFAQPLAARFGAHKWQGTIPSGTTRYFSALVHSGNE